MRIKNYVWSVLSLLTLVPGMAHAYPVIDRIALSGEYPFKVYPDDQQSGVYWYIPISIEPWTRDRRYQSSLVKGRNSVSFVFRGQASVAPEALQSAADALRVPVANLVPIAYDYSKDLTCGGIYAGDPNVKFAFPSQIGNYLEVLPISIRAAHDDDLVDEIYQHITGSGLECTVKVGFKAVSTAYKLDMRADMNRVFDRFEAAAHAQGVWWEVDVHHLTESLVRDGTITIKTLEDASMPQTELDRKVQAAMDEINKQVLAMIFTPVLKLPEEAMAGRGAAWSLRVDSRHVEERAHFHTVLQSDKIQVKDSLIGVRLANH